VTQCQRSATIQGTFEDVYKLPKLFRKEVIQRMAVEETIGGSARYAVIDELRESEVYK
jgi:hypothetical protein